MNKKYNINNINIDTISKTSYNSIYQIWKQTKEKTIIESLSNEF